MAYDSGFSRRSASEREIQPVAIVSVDPTSRTAIGVTRVRSKVTINCAYATGDTITIPAVGEQWYCERFDMEWRLYGRIPFNDATLNIEPEEGQVSVGSASGPLELNGPEIRFNSKVFRLNGVYYRDSGTALERSTDQVTWTAVSAATATTLAQELAAALAGYQGTDSLGALSAIRDWSDLVKLVTDNFSQFWNLLCDNSFISGLKGLGFGDTDVAKIIDGFQNFLNYLFGTIFCDFNGDLTPQVLLARIRDLLAPIASNPFILALQEFSTLLTGTTNGLLQDAINGVVKFIQTLFDVLFCQADPTELTAILGAVGDTFGPVAIIQAIETFFDVFRINPFIAGLSSFLNTIAPNLFTGNLLQDAVIGGTKFLSTLFGVLTCDPTALTTLAGYLSGTPGLTTPQGILATLAGLVTSLMTNPLITAIQTFASQYLGLNGTLLQQIITGTGDLFNWFFKALTTFLPFVPWQALLPFLDWTAINDATVNGITFPSLLTTNLFSMFDGLFGGTLGAFKNFLTNLGTLFNGMGLLDAILEFDPGAAVRYFLVNILGIASEVGDVLQLGGTIVTATLGAIGDFFENIRDFLGFDLRNFAEGALTPIYMAALFLDRIEEALLSWVKTLVLGGSASLVEWAQANILVPVIGNFLTGLKIDWRTLGYSTVEDLLNAGWSSLSQIAGKLLTSMTQIPANLISGVLPPGILGTVPVSSIADVSQNLLAQGAFADGVSVEAGDNWIWDSTESVTGTGGSVKVTVSPAKNRYLYARQAVPVAVGDRLIVNASIKTSGLLLNNVGNTPISISIIPYAGSTQASSAIQIGSASGPSSSWKTIGNSKSSPYTVTNSTWTSIIVQLKVDTGTYSGSVWWDDITVAKTGLLVQNNVDSLIAAWNSTIGGLTGLGTAATGKTWEDLLNAANNVRSRANEGVEANAGTVTTLDQSPQTLIKNLIGVKVDGYYSMEALLGYLSAGLSTNGAITGADAFSVKLAAEQARYLAGVGGNGIAGIKTNPQLYIDSLANVIVDGIVNMTTLLQQMTKFLSSNTTTTATTVSQLYTAGNAWRQNYNTDAGTQSTAFTYLYGPGGAPLPQIQATALPTSAKYSEGSGATVTRNIAGAVNLTSTPVGGTSLRTGNYRLQNYFYTFPSDPSLDVGRRVATDTGALIGWLPRSTGWYMVSYCLGLNAAQTADSSGSVVYDWGVTPTLWYAANGGTTSLTLNQYGPEFTHITLPSVQNYGWGPRYAQANFIIYCQANSLVAPGVAFSATTQAGYEIPLLYADGTGKDNYFTISLLNRSLA